mgnify:CR=1 FL=1
MQHILVCDDEKDIVAALKIYLEADGYCVHAAYTGADALKIVREEPVQLALMDIMMPGMDGITAMAKLREFTNIPVILLTAKSEDSDKILGLSVGADDYITKPFGSMELLARVHANLRRYEQILQLKNAAAVSQKETEEAHTLTAGGLELDLYTKQLTVDGKNVKLTPKEYAILELLMRSPGRVYSAEQIYENVWKEEAINTETIMVHVRKLREKIEVNPRNPRYLKVVWGIGYKIEK